MTAVFGGAAVLFFALWLVELFSRRAAFKEWRLALEQWGESNDNARDCLALVDDALAIADGYRDGVDFETARRRRMTP